MSTEDLRTDAAGIVYSVLAWLTTREERVELGSHFDAAPAAELAQEFCVAEGLGEPRDDWDGGAVQRDFPWSSFVANAELINDFSSDSYDLSVGEIVVNVNRDVRIFLGDFASSSSHKFDWLNPVTGGVHCSSVEIWSKWAGEQLWILSNSKEDGWFFRSPFANGIVGDEDKP